jgi:hypothetical protein
LRESKKVERGQLHPSPHADQGETGRPVNFRAARSST